MHIDKPDTIEFMGIDLREIDDAAKVERVLSMWDVSEPLAELAKKRTAPKDVVRWLLHLEGGSELVGIVPTFNGSDV